MADPKKSAYARLASRFAHLALGAKEEDDEDEDKKKEARAEDEPEAEEENEKEKSKKAKKARADEEDGDDEEAKAAAYSAGYKASNDRWADVMASPEAKGRVGLACSLLADSDMSANAVRRALLASPAEKPAAPHGLAARMASIQRPDVGSAPAAAPPDPTSPAAQAAEIVKAYRQARG